MRWLSKCPGGLCVVSLLLSGCAGGLASHLPGFASKDDNTTFATPAKRMTQLAELQESVARMAPAEQEKAATTLATQIRTEDDPVLRESMVKALIKNPSPTASKLLNAALQDPDAHVRLVAVEAIAERGGTGAVESLGGVVQGDGNIDVRLAAARGLGKLKDPASVSMLAVALESPDPALQYRAMQSLKEVSGKNLGDDVAAWRQYAKTGTPPPPKPFSLVEGMNKLNPF